MSLAENSANLSRDSVSGLILVNRYFHTFSESAVPFIKTQNEVGSRNVFKRKTRMAFINHTRYISAQPSRISKFKSLKTMI